MNQSPILNNPLSDQNAKANSVFNFSISNNIFSDPDAINPFDNFVIFGDSLSDTGNAYQASGNTFPLPPYYQGRFSNGLLWVDYLSQKLEFSDESVKNFAFAGANTGVSNVIDGFPIIIPGLLSQIEQFKTVNANTPVGEDTLYVIWAGSNDFDFPNPTADPVQSVTNIGNAITTLSTLGAKEIVVANLTDLSARPLNINSNNTEDGRAFSIDFKNALSQEVNDLEPSLNIDISVVDIFGLNDAVQANPEDYNFTNLTEPLISATGDVNPDEYAFWDDVHPTTRLHQLVSQRFAETLINDGIIPDLITYSATLADGSDLPDWLEFNSITQTFSGTPTDENVGQLDVKVIATDKEGLTATDIFSLQIQGINVSTSEGNSGINTKAFTVFLDEASTESVTVNYQTVPITATPVSDTTKEVFAAILEGNQQVPTGVTTTASGLASAELDTEAATFSYRLEVTGLDFNNQTATTDDDVTMLHIHNAARGANGPVDFDILTDDDKQITVENGKTIITGIWEASEGLTPEEIETLKSATTGTDTPYYFNIHTTTNPNGELRGQIINETPVFVPTKEVFAAILEGNQQVPTGVTTTASGMASAELDTEAATFSYRLEVTGLDFNNQTATTDDDVILAHIHNAARGVNGPVDFDILADDDKQITVENGKTIITGIWEASEGLTAEEIESLKSAATGTDTPYYFNIHTTTNPNGELRGQIVSTAPDYISTSGTLTFAPGETSKTVEVPIFGDTQIEADETFKIVLSDAADSSQILGEQVITIMDDDHPSRKLIFGTPNGEELNPEPGQILLAGDGDDTINSTADNDIFAGDGNDVVIVNSHSSVSAGDGDDNVTVGVDGPAHDTIVNGGNGEDKLFVAEADGTNNIFGAADADEITVIEGSHQFLFGGSGDDKIVSQGSNNRLFGGSGIDVLVSNQNDSLSGGEGDDVLFAGKEGGNKLTGGAGIDQFWVANGSLPITKNTVTDFTIGVDKIGFGGVEILNFGQVIKEQMGADTLLKTGTTEIALLVGINANSLTANDFAFSASVVSI
ncbi:CHRD domain-containing protein [Anabaena sp. PCC 7108]|uniref:CHRD domain-containing protein n=1 Tax=Anabaena sp. PCC 7108 TaxID=163908 RepID=UPI000345C5BA|nr:CHRD domain-containing protein [Anabaena sp. PCC 7108]